MTPNVTGTSFVIAVRDLQASAAFYRDVLGFTVQAIPDPGWLFFRAGDCTIMAGECPDAMPVADTGFHSYCAYLQLQGIDEYHSAVCAAGARLCKPLREEPWGYREFGVTTADGHRIMFGEPVVPR